MIKKLSYVILTKVLYLKSHPAPNIRVAAVWCIINWTWITCDDDEDGKCWDRKKSLFGKDFADIPATALAERVNRLRALGVEQQLRVMEKDSSRDVRDRVRTALDQMTALES